MGKIIVIANHKGGVGKTTVAINLADTFNHLGYNTLMIDLDSQHNTSDTYCAKIEDEYTMVDVLRQGCTARDAIQHKPLGDIIPGDDLLAQEIKPLIRQNDDDSLAYLLKNLLKSVKDEYEYIILDTSPSLDIYMEMALNCADELIVPITSQIYAVKGLNNLTRIIKRQKDTYNPELKFLGVLLNIYDRRNGMDRDIKESLEDYGQALGFNVLNTHIRISQEVKKAQALEEINENGEIIDTNKSLLDNYPNSVAASNYVKLAQEIIELENGRGGNV